MVKKPIVAKPAEKKAVVAKPVEKKAGLTASIIKVVNKEAKIKSRPGKRPFHLCRRLLAHLQLA